MEKGGFPMRKFFLAATALAVFGIGSTALAGSTGVQITSSGFTPSNVSVQSGDSVNWTNADSVRHRVVVNGAPCTLILEPSQSSSCTFPTPGTFPYDDSLSGFKGTVTVAPNTRAVTITSSRTIGIFGDAMTLSGTVSSKAAGEHVTVVSTPSGLPATRTEVVTTSGGNWALEVQPRVRTTYQALYDNAASGKLTIALRPRLTFQKVGRHQYLVVILASRSMAGKRLDIARWSGGRWLIFRHATIARIPRTTTTSVVYFTAPVRLGTKLRAFLPSNQVGPDYTEGHSNFVVN
jgi:plastocyanin